MIPHPDDTIVALASTPGPGRRAIVRLSGQEAHRIRDALFVSDQPEAEPRTLAVGSLRLTHLHSPLPCSCYSWSAPYTYTAQDLVEFHTISSPPLVERLLADVLSRGARVARPGEFTLRAFLSGKKDLTQAEAILAVIHADTDAELRPALDQLAGGLTLPLESVRNDLLNLLADIEAGLDFVDEDIEFVSTSDILLRVASALAHLQNLLRQLNTRTRSDTKLRVALVGDPNAGKSSLFNALIGESAALVSPRAGTTRDYLSASLRLGEAALELLDTAGWQAAEDTIEVQAQRLGEGLLPHSALILWCVPMSESVPPGRLAWLREQTGADLMIVRTKADLTTPANDPADPNRIVTSVKSANGLDQLRIALREQVMSLQALPQASSSSRCRHHVEGAMNSLRRAHEHAREGDPQELLALALREALDQLGEMVGAVFTNDLLDRIFSRFCIGK